MQDKRKRTKTDILNEYQDLKKDVLNMNTSAKIIDPEDYILAVLSPEERLEAAFNVAAQAFKKSPLTVQDIEKAVKTVRRKAYEKKR